MLSLCEKICMANADIRKPIHALDNEDNYDRVKCQSITHTDFLTNFLKALLFGKFLACLFYYLHVFSSPFGI
jgi:hypothetical protein